MIELIYKLLKKIDNVNYLDQVLVTARDRRCYHGSKRNTNFQVILARECSRHDVYTQFINHTFSWADVDERYNYKFSRLHDLLNDYD